MGLKVLLVLGKHREGPESDELVARFCTRASERLERTMNYHPSVDAERSAFSINTFCLRNEISKPTYFKMQRDGIAPRTMHIGRKTLISVEAERDWRKARERPDKAEARLIRLEAEARKANATRAGRKSASLPGHISKQPSGTRRTRHRAQTKG